MRLPVSMSAVAMMVSEPASSVLRAAAKIRRGISRARASTPPDMVRPPPAMALLKARPTRVIESSRMKTSLPAFDEALGALDGELGDAGVALHVAVVRAGHDLGGRARCGVISVTSSGRSSTSRMMSLMSGMILHHGIADVLEEGGLAGARRGDDEAALAFADRRT